MHAFFDSGKRWIGKGLRGQGGSARAPASILVIRGVRLAPALQPPQFVLQGMHALL